MSLEHDSYDGERAARFFFPQNHISIALAIRTLIGSAIL